MKSLLFSGAVEALTRVVYQRNTLNDVSFSVEEKENAYHVKKNTTGHTSGEAAHENEPRLRCA